VLQQRSIETAPHFSVVLNSNLSPTNRFKGFIWKSLKRLFRGGISHFGHHNKLWCWYKVSFRKYFAETNPVETTPHFNGVLQQRGIETTPYFSVVLLQGDHLSQHHTSAEYCGKNT
jgi:hypothetical protein